VHTVLFLSLEYTEIVLTYFCIVIGWQRIWSRSLMNTWSSLMEKWSCFVILSGSVWLVHEQMAHDIQREMLLCFLMLTVNVNRTGCHHCWHGLLTIG